MYQDYDCIFHLERILLVCTYKISYCFETLHKIESFERFGHRKSMKYKISFACPKTMFYSLKASCLFMQSRASSEIYLFFYHFPIKFIISACLAICKKNFHSVKGILTHYRYLRDINSQSIMMNTKIYTVKSIHILLHVSIHVREEHYLCMP